MTVDPIRTVKVEANFTYKLSDQIRSDDKHSALVFKGLFNGTIPIALKRYQKENATTIKQVQQDLDVLSSPENRHLNFIRYFGYATDDFFCYLLTELAECSVADIIDPKKKLKAQQKTPYFGAILTGLSKKEILRQSSEAVNFLHRPQWNVIHRNLHPENFLIICVDPDKDYFLIKLTDFKLSKSIEKNPQNTGTLSKEGWIAPESFTTNIELTNKLDAFILGCFYFYVLSGGKHPFGKGVTTQQSRITNEYDLVYQSHWDGKPEWNSTEDHHNFTGEEEEKWALQMIKDLIKYNPNDRKSVDDVLKSKYFQPEPYVIYDNPSSPLPGLCVILSQEKFHNPIYDLDDKLDSYGVQHKGLGLEVERLSFTFKPFGYDILIFRNLRATQIKSYLSSSGLENFAKKPLRNYASLIVCLMGHGDKGVLYGVDDVPVSLNEIQYEAFNDLSCPDLKGKPKIFIVLACQGEKIQPVIQRLTNEPSSSSASMAIVNSIINNNNEEYQLPPVYDFIRFVSTIEEYQSYFYYGTGSVYIQSLCDALRNEYKDVVNPEKKEKNKRDLIQLFTEFVIPIVGRSGGDLKQTPEFRSSLIKTIRFRRQETHGIILNEYDGGKQDPSFVHARKYREALLQNPH